MVDINNTQVEGLTSTGESEAFEYDPIGKAEWLTVLTWSGLYVQTGESCLSPSIRSNQLPSYL
ncbi:hypothetical protein [Jeotgalibacillus soli]|uniref:Uncharacterized protein n=1 Tax=Jeotgalibacillus soli TaxID=889306 RepID=A0A0C2VHY2_9BACL|nr:hypothetical protein [Jeotgalibacillus soli]KIL48477.1 hypothetical protein KP78_15600 [Jeotgalibacillus soli]